MSSRRHTASEQKERIRQRVRVQIDEANYEYYPEHKEPDYYDDDISQRVGVYVRVSTDDPRQTTSYELQKKYYEDFVIRHPKWTLVDIYADEGISGTSIRHRTEFNRMIMDCKNGKVDLIITKSVSRFARNVVDFLGMVRMLSEQNPPIGVFFESENIFSLNETSNMALSFQATMAEEESRNKSRSMETSLRMRLDHGLPLTPKLLGFTHDNEGKLIPNPETEHIPKLMFYMYLYGYSTQQIADTLTAMEKKTYLGNVCWTASGVAQTMRNERYCGDVYTRKTFTKDVLSHKSIKNRGERPISHYYGEHIGIISRDDFIAVQHMLKNSRYGNKSVLPELRVITEGLLKGFVIINPRWGAFKEQDYFRASASAYGNDEKIPMENKPVQFQVEAGDFDMRGFEIAHMDLFDNYQTPSVSFGRKSIKFGAECIKRMNADFNVELLVHPSLRKFAVRPADKNNKNSVIWAKMKNGRKEARVIACAAYYETLLSIFGWKREYKYRMYSSLISDGKEEAYIFEADEATAFIQSDTVEDQTEGGKIEPIDKAGIHVRGIPACYSDCFGNDFYAEKSYSALAKQTRKQWQLRVEGQLCNTGMQLNVTDYDTLRRFIQEELGDLALQEGKVNEQH